MLKHVKLTRRDKLRKQFETMKASPEDKRRRRRLFRRLKASFLKSKGRFMDAEETIDAAFVRTARLRDAARESGRARTLQVPARKKVAYVAHLLHLELDTCEFITMQLNHE